MSQHTPEPWHVHDNESYLEIRGDVYEIANTCASKFTGEDCNIDISEANARRIVACVNACEGSDTEVLEALGGDFAKPLIDLIDQRDELLAALKLYEQAFDGIFAQCCSNPIKDTWGRDVDCSLLNEAHCAAGNAIAKAEAKS